MKKLAIVTTLVLAVALIASPAFAIDAGKWRLGGAANLSNQTISPDGSDDMTSMNLSGEIGYFVANNIEIGLSLDYANEDDGTEEITTTIYTPFVQYWYALQENKHLLSGGVGYTSWNVSNGTEVDMTGYLLQVGYHYLMAENVSLDVSLQYVSGTVDEGGSETDVTMTSFPQIGLSIWF